MAVTLSYPKPRSTQTKLFQVARTDTTASVMAVLPKSAVIVGDGGAGVVVGCSIRRVELPHSHPVLPDVGLTRANSVFVNPTRYRNPCRHCMRRDNRQGFGITIRYYFEWVCCCSVTNKRKAIRAAGLQSGAALESKHLPGHITSDYRLQLRLRGVGVAESSTPKATHSRRVEINSRRSYKPTRVNIKAADCVGKPVKPSGKIFRRRNTITSVVWCF